MSTRPRSTTRPDTRSTGWIWPVPDPIDDREQLVSALRLIQREAEAFLGQVDDALVRPPGEPEIDAALPSEGVGSLQALTSLAQSAMEGATRSTGPRFFHFVMGG